MILLQKMPEMSWNGMGMTEMAIFIGSYVLFLIFLFLIIRYAVSTGMREQRRQSRITNQLLAELLRQQGVSNDRIEGIMLIGNKGRRKYE
jgi:hypothetical protein